MVPERRSAIVTVAMRAFVSGCCVCFMTASIAGKYSPNFYFHLQWVILFHFLQGLLMTDDILNALVDSTNGSNNSTM